MPRVFEFTYDFCCPYAYIAFGGVETIQARTDAEVDPQPILLSQLREALGGSATRDGEAKRQHQQLDVRRLAQVAELPLATTTPPSTTEPALRAVLAAPVSHRWALSKRFFQAAWAEGLDLADPTILAAAIAAEGLDASSVLERAASAAILSELRSRTVSAAERGVFGVPSCIVDGELFFGADRLHFVEAALGGKPTCPYPTVAKAQLRPVDVWYDYASPFAYLGVLGARSALGPAVRLKPMLLGKVFEAVGQAMVPIFEASPAQRDAFRRDLERQAESVGLAFSFPSRFPMNTVRALRITLAAERQDRAKAGALVERIFRAYWAEDQDIADEAVLVRIAGEVGLDGPKLAEQAATPDGKKALFTATAAAVAAGVFGAPTFIVHRPDGGQSLFWGSDRLHIAAQAAAGHQSVY